MKLIVLLFILFNSSLADTAKEELRGKIHYALTCNAQWSKVGEVEISILKPSKKYPGSYIVSGVYKSILSTGISFKKLTTGDEFHPQSGSFKGIVDESLELTKLQWKVSFKKGFVEQRCLTLSENDL